ncbi:hypothetical protein [Paenibacillus macquariensis]|uniref:hypothetical protein n=1 Tax=Paenibacillus macquariensis TaxID=948756 RepID=UPI0007C2B1E7|nr:hypothetical protein PMSM_14555 [Paenibacillus macquariensis subsp. macquariensis]
MRMAIRINFSENHEDQRALSQAGGRIVFPHNKPPMFGFDNEEQRIRYEQFRKMYKNEKVTTAATEITLN